MPSPSYQSVEFGGHPMRTLFDGVFQVPPGHYLIATEKHVQLHRSIGISIIRRPDAGAAPRSDADYAAEFRQRWRKRFAFACAPTFRSAAISAAGSIPARCSASRHGIIPSRSALSR